VQVVIVVYTTASDVEIYHRRILILHPGGKIHICAILALQRQQKGLQTMEEVRLYYRILQFFAVIMITEHESADVVQTMDIVGALDPGKISLISVR
jgi:hypothetical protein